MAKKLIVVTLTLSALIGSTIADLSLTTSVQNGVRKSHESGELIFEDNFDTLDFDKWEHEITMSGGGNWEFQVYWNNRSNSYCTDSTLFLKPKLTSDRFGDEMVRNGHLDLWGGQPGDLCTMPSFYGCERVGDGRNIINPVSSARLRTAKSFAFTYGKVEVRAKLPSGDWLWPAIWMLPLKQEYGLWPTSGEIDIMESRGNLNLMKDGVNIGAEQYGSTLHFGVDYIINGQKYAHADKNTPAGNGFNVDFHTYGVEWTPEKFTFLLDDSPIGEVVIPEGGFWELGQFETDYGEGMKNPWEMYAKNAPFDKDFYLILNLAAGGTNGYFPDEATNSPPKPWSNQSPNAFLDFWNAKESWYNTWDQEGDESAFQIDYVKVWAL